MSGYAPFSFNPPPPPPPAPEPQAPRFQRTVAYATVPPSPVQLPPTSLLGVFECLSTDSRNEILPTTLFIYDSCIAFTSLSSTRGRICGVLSIASILSWQRCAAVPQAPGAPPFVCPVSMPAATAPGATLDAAQLFTSDTRVHVFWGLGPAQADALCCYQTLDGAWRRVLSTPQYAQGPAPFLVAPASLVQTAPRGPPLPFVIQQPPYLAPLGVPPTAQLGGAQTLCGGGVQAPQVLASPAQHPAFQGPRQHRMPPPVPSQQPQQQRQQQQQQQPHDRVPSPPHERTPGTVVVSHPPKEKAREGGGGGFKGFSKMLTHAKGVVASHMNRTRDRDQQAPAEDPPASPRHRCSQSPSPTMRSSSSGGARVCGGGERPRAPSSHSPTDRSSPVSSSADASSSPSQSPMAFNVVAPAGFKVLKLRSGEASEYERLTEDAREGGELLALEPAALGFGLGSRQAPVDAPIADQLTLSNAGREKVSFRVVCRASPKWELSFSPESGKVGPGRSLQVAVELRVNCTSKSVRPEVAVVHWVGGQKALEQGAAQRHVVRPRIVLESLLTTRLDNDELSLFDMPIGDGSFGVVWRGQYRGLDVAVKILKYQTGVNPQMAKDFASEVAVLERIRHPCIINYVGAVHFPGQLAIVTDASTTAPAA
eukprot:m51a1_g10837 putative serine-threonine protein (652) ;mRNA; f:56086-58543